MRSIVVAYRTALLLSIFAAAEPALAADFILATGRRDPRIYAIDFKAALRTPNNRTPNAIVSRSKVQVDRLDGTPVGDPANIVLSEDRRTAYVINHHGAIDNAAFLQHGGRGSVSVMDVQKMINPHFDNTDAALEQSYDSGYFGGVGLLVLPDVLLVSHSENWLTEDGSNRISLIDRKTGSRVGQIEMALGHPGHACPDFPVPFVSPTPPPVVPFLSPDPQFGCWPNPEFLALGNGSDGKTYLFSGNAGTDDVSVMDLQSALAGVPVVEVAPRVPVQTGPFGIKASPNGKLIAVTARESGEGRLRRQHHLDHRRRPRPHGRAGRRARPRARRHGRPGRPVTAVHACLDAGRERDRRRQLPDEQRIDRRRAPRAGAPPGRRGRAHPGDAADGPGRHRAAGQPEGHGHHLGRTLRCRSRAGRALIPALRRAGQCG